MVRIRVHVKLLRLGLLAKVLGSGLWVLIYLGLLNKDAELKAMIPTASRTHNY